MAVRPVSYHHGHHSTNHRIHNYDRLAVGLLTFLFILYTVVTVYTYTSISVAKTSSSPSSSSPLDSSQTQRRQLERKQQQQQQQQQQPVDPEIAILKLQHTFPIHVGTDTIEILHPAVEILEALQQRQQPNNNNKKNVPKRRELPKEITRTIVVPMFFDESHGRIYSPPNGTIRQYLNDGNTLLTPEQASKIGSYYTDPTISGTDDLETIYCSIASYRDPECPGSLEDLFTRAKYPDRIRVAIIDQRLPNSNDPICKDPVESCDGNPNQALCKYQHLIDYYEIDARLAVGPVFARHLAHRHYRGEYYAMQIDSHVRFTEHWDVDIIGQFKSANNEMAVLTTYLSDIIDSIDPVTHKNTHHGRPIMCASDYEGAGQYKHLRHGQQPEGEPGIRGQPTLHPFWAAGFSFARGHFVIQVPYDQYLPMVFQGEEISIGLRGFTYGYDYYAPERSVCFHMYAIKENEAKRKAIPLFWENSDMYTGVGMMSMRRLNSIIGMTGKFHYMPGKEWNPIEERKYGLGTVRNTSKFFDVFGIHTATETVEHHLCRFVGKPMMKLFLPALRSNKMGINYDEIDYRFVDAWKNEPE